MQPVVAVVRTSAFFLASSGPFIRPAAGEGPAKSFTMFGLLQAMGSFQPTSGHHYCLPKAKLDESKITIRDSGSALIERKQIGKA